MRLSSACRGWPLRPHVQPRTERRASVSTPITRHAESSATWREGLMVAIDAANNIVGGIILLALPLAVLAPGLVALLALGIPLLLPFVALGLAFAIVSIPFVGIWWLVRTLRGVSRGRRTDPAAPRRGRAGETDGSPETAPEGI